MDDFFSKVRGFCHDLSKILLKKTLKHPKTNLQKNMRKTSFILHLKNVKVKEQHFLCCNPDV